MALDIRDLSSSSRHGRFVQDVLGQRVRVVHVGLVYGLAVPFPHNRCRSIRRDAEERDACVECLCKRRSVVDCSRARSANDRNRRPSRQRHAKGMMGRSPFVDADANLNVRVAMEGEHERRVTRPWTHHRVLHAMLGKDGCNRRPLPDENCSRPCCEGTRRSTEKGGREALELCFGL